MFIQWKKQKQKTVAIQSAPVPKNVTELSSLAMLYYRKFTPNLATFIQPTTALLHKDAIWYWSENYQVLLMMQRNLFSQSVSTFWCRVIVCDASPYGVDAVIGHKMKDESKEPNAFASRMFIKTEPNRITSK